MLSLSYRLYSNTFLLNLGGLSGGIASVAIGWITVLWVMRAVLLGVRPSAAKGSWGAAPLGPAWAP